MAREHATKYRSCGSSSSPAPTESSEMNSTSSSYWQEQQLMDALVRGIQHKAKLGGSSTSDSDGSVSPTSSSGDSGVPSCSDDKVRNWLDVRIPSLHRTQRAPLYAC